jgi:DNA polymerase
LQQNSVKIALVGEAYGEEEDRQKVPFIGASGRELTRMLNEAGIRRTDCFLTNVLNLRPPNNNLDALCTTKKEDSTGLPPLRPGKYLRAEYLPEIDRLMSELRELRPNVVVALGGTATWALLGNGGISKIRGTVSRSHVLPGQKVLPTYHPAAILRDWSLRHVTVLDLAKAARESEFPEIRRPERLIYIEPGLNDMEMYFDEHLARARRIAVDIETVGEQITCIGFAPSPETAIVIPFTDLRKPTGNYWASLEEERLAWKWVRRVLQTEAIKIFQNGLYDVTFLWKQYGMPVRNFEEDTMLMSHAIQPESPKGLAYLGSCYTLEAAWKLDRPRGKHTIKRDE